MDKRVLLVRNVHPNTYGGGESYQLFLADALKRNGFDPIIISSSERLLKKAKCFKYKFVRAPFCRNQNWSGWRNILIPIYLVWQIRLYFWYRKQIKKYRPIVMNIQSRDDWLAGTLAAKRNGVDVLWTDHADFKNWVLWNVNSTYKNFIGKKIIKYSKFAKKVIFVSENLAKETKKMIAPKEIKNSIVIENGVRDRKDYYKNVKSQKDSFVFIGRITKDKGVEELIEAFGIVKEQNTDAVLNFYGEGELEPFEKKAAKYSDIVFNGVTDEPLRVMAENEIFVLPSYKEGLSLSLLDALMMGRTIIATKIDGNSEAIIDKETGILVPVKNVGALAKAMKYMLENRGAAKKLGENARKFYKENFDFDKIFEEKMLPLYNNGKEKK